MEQRVFDDVNTLIYMLVGLGAIGVYLLLPRAGRSYRTAGRIVACATLAGLGILVSSKMRSIAGPQAYFYVFAGLAVVFATCVITQTRPVYSALYFILVMINVAALLLLMEAEFLAIALVIIYGGAILVTYLFVIMLSQQSGEAFYDRQARGPLAACIAGFLVVATTGSALTDFLSSPDALPSVLQIERGGQALDDLGNTQAVGLVVLNHYVVVLQIAGVLLLLAMAGAVAIASKKFPPDPWVAGQQRVRVGEAGRTAEPF